MSLVPFAGSAPARSTLPSDAARPGLPADKVPAGERPARPPAGSRADRLAGAARTASRFAHVLDAVRHDDPLPAGARSASATTEAPVSGPDTRPAAARGEDPAVPSTVVAANEPAAPSPPWLVLALGLAAQDQPGDVPHPPSAGSSGEDAGYRAGIDGSPLTNAADAPRWGTTQNSHELNGSAVAGAEDVPGDVPPALEPEPGVTAAAEAPTPGQATAPAQSAELLARWRAATRASGAEVAAEALPASGGRTGGAGVAGASSSGASRRLAELLGQESERGAPARGWGAAPNGDKSNGPALAGTETTPGDVSLALKPEPDVTAAAVAPTPGQATAPAQSAELLARWRAATRASGGEVTAQALPAGEGRSGEAAAPGAAGGAASRRLAEFFGQAAESVTPAPREDGADGSASLGMAPGATRLSEGGSGGATRSSDLLLAAAHDGHGSSAAGEGAAPPPPTSLLATATVSAADVRAAPPAAPVVPPTVADQVVQQIVSSIKMQWKDGIGEAKLQLRPDALGAVTVSLRVEHGAVTAVVRTESAQVQEWVLQHQASLRQQMEDAGLRLEELVVSPDEQRQPEQGDHEADPERRRPRTPRADAGTLDSPRFELLL